jgi:hypothetical protein
MLLQKLPKHLPEIPGGKKLIYSIISMTLIAIADPQEHGKKDPVMAHTGRNCLNVTTGLWNAEAEKFLLPCQTHYNDSQLIDWSLLAVAPHY